MLGPWSMVVGRPFLQLLDALAQEAQVPVVDAVPFQPAMRIEQIFGTAAQRAAGRGKDAGRLFVAETPDVGRVVSIHHECERLYLGLVGSPQSNPSGGIGTGDHLALPQQAQFTFKMVPDDPIRDSAA